MRSRIGLLILDCIFFSLLICLFLLGCNNSTKLNDSVPPDTTPPTVAIVSPADNATVNGVVHITTDVTDNVAVRDVVFYIDSVEVSGSTDISDPYEYDWDTQSLTDAATHTINARATDTSNNSTLSTSVTVTVDNGPTEFDIELTPDKLCDGDGQNVDTPDFFNAGDPTESMLFVTGRDSKTIEVWKYPYDTQIRTMNISGTPNGVAVDGNRLYVGIYGSNPRVEVYELPNITLVQTIGEGIIRSGETNLDVIHLTSGNTRIYVSDDTPRVLGFDVGTGQIEVIINLSSYFPKVETVLCDDFHQIVFIPDEDGRDGVHYFTPEGSHLGSFGKGDFEYDAEGITMYDAGNGEGYIILSDQKNPLNDYEFYDRVTFEHVGVLHLTGINYTDGIAMTHQSSPLFPAGVFAVIDNDTRTALISWQRILDEIER